VARKTSASTTHCRLNKFDTANRTFWDWYNYQKVGTKKDAPSLSQSWRILVF